ncbi:MAG: histidine phosphatase family protein [Planctomycetota bacterium]
MLRRLIVMRHAKSSWKDVGQTDHERPLNKRGRQDAPRVGERLAALGWRPERVLSSDARRTRETCELLCGEWEPAPEVSFHEELYLAGPSTVADLLRELPDELETALVLGHNDGWEHVVAWLSGRREHLTTANAALLSLEAASWSAAVDAAPGWTLHEVVRPKEL